MKTFKWVAVLLLLSGCGVTVSEVVPAGKDTYMISGYGRATAGSESLLELYKAANQYCTKLERHFLPVSTNTEPYGQLSSSASMNFRCLLEGDKELERPMMKPAANTRIEIAK